MHQGTNAPGVRPDERQREADPEPQRDHSEHGAEWH